MELNSKEQKTYDTIAKIMNNELTRKEAMFELHKSRQQIYNLIKVYNEQGMEGFVHKNRGRTPANKLNNQLIKELENLYLDEYYDYNFEAFYDELSENKKYKDKYDISYSSLHMYFLNDDIISPVAHKETIKLYNEKLNNAINKKEDVQEEKLELFQSRQITFSNQENEVNTTQFGRICIELGIELITTSVATAKANVERENRTFKDRLVAELRHEGITDIDEGNRYLNEVFIPKMNKKFSYEIDKRTSMMKQNNYSEQELNLIISERTTRIIDNASSIKYENKYYVPVDSDTGEVVSYMRKTECIVILTYNAELWCKIENNFYLLEEIEDRNTMMKKEIDNAKPIERKEVIPPKNHPWRKNMMLR